jgi:hypothetical protein
MKDSFYGDLERVFDKFSKQKVKLSPYLTKHCLMEEYGGVDPLSLALV